MLTPLSECGRALRELDAAIVELEQAARLLELTALADREWFQLLRQKLLPQLGDEAYLVVAVVGGTNIGKSLIFNHIAGGPISGTSPLASRTRHPVCLVPPGFRDAHDLADVFPGFELQRWTSPESPLDDGPRDRLFWRTDDAVAERLLLLDTPDIDSDARVNWRRADRIRRCADVLIAVLTQQKYNDAAVKRFFRQAAAEDKAVLVVFNQCQLPDDESIWPMWLQTFCAETGVQPAYVYLVPHDRTAAAELRLPFFERKEVDRSVAGVAGAAPRELGVDLARLRFDEIKLRTLRGALRRLLDADDGVPAWLDELQCRAGEFRSAAELLALRRLAEFDEWPLVPVWSLVETIRCWWRSQRRGWTATVHGVYNALGRGLTWPVRAVRGRVAGPPLQPLDAYRQHEWQAVLDVVQTVYERLEWVCKLGNDLLRPRLERVLGGVSRGELLERLRAAHGEVDFQQELAELVDAELRTFRAESPQFYRFLKRLDTLAAAARPATSMVLFIAGFGPLGDAAANVVAHTAVQAAGEAAAQSAAHVAGDVAVGTVTAVVGETTLSHTAASGVGYLEAKFRRVRDAFAERRAEWMAGQLQEHLLKSLIEELAAAAGVAGSSAFGRASQAIAALACAVSITPQEPIVKEP